MLELGAGTTFKGPALKAYFQQLDPASYRFPQSPKQCHQMETRCLPYELMGDKSDPNSNRGLREAAVRRQEQREGNALRNYTGVSDITWVVWQLCYV